MAVASLLLAGCGSQPSEPPTAPVELSTAPHSKLLNELSGSLIGAPAGSDVELALLVVDERDRPQRLLASQALAGTGNALPFRLRFDPQQFPGGARIELRARISQSGRLILRLPPQRVLQADSRDFGALPLVSAP